MLPVSVESAPPAAYMGSENGVGDGEGGRRGGAAGGGGPGDGDSGGVGPVLGHSRPLERPGDLRPGGVPWVRLRADGEFVGADGDPRDFQRVSDAHLPVGAGRPECVDATEAGVLWALGRLALRIWRVESQRALPPTIRV